MQHSYNNVGDFCFSLAEKLFPICRSITGPGVRETLNILRAEIPEITIQSVKTGYQAFDWTVPQEWSINGGYIEDLNGNKIIDFCNNNLHVVNYSTPVNTVVSFDELNKHLFSLEEISNAVPYVASYYKRDWGFCLTHDQKKRLDTSAKYKVFIDSAHYDGELNYGELIINPGREKEIFFSTYLCHPSMANNELSGPVLAIAIAKYIISLADLKYSYRFVFLPETIGSIVYLSKHLPEMKQRIYSGFNLTCVGDERTYSFLPSRNGNTISDRVAKYALRNMVTKFTEYSWFDRGSDERQYCAPGVDLPVASVMRSKYGEYPEYHTSLDDLSLISPKGLQGSFEVYKFILNILEKDCFPKSAHLCEPQLGKRGLYHDVTPKYVPDTKMMMDILSMADGKHSILDIAETLSVGFQNVYETVQLLKTHHIVE